MESRNLNELFKNLRNKIHVIKALFALINFFKFQITAKYSYSSSIRTEKEQIQSI